MLVAATGCSTPTRERATPSQRETTGAATALEEIARHAPIHTRLGDALLTPSDAGWAVEAGPRAALRVVLPARSSAPMLIETASGPVSIAATALADRPGTRQGSALVYDEVAAATDLVMAPARGGAEELRVLYDASAPTSFGWTITPPEGGRVRMSTVGVEVLDAGGKVVLAAETPFAIDRQGVRRDLQTRLHANTLLADLDVRDLEYPIVVDPSWTAVPNMRTVRFAPIALPLSDGQVMIVPNDTAPYVDIYDPVTNSWSTGPDIPIPWTNARGIVLDDGDVLVVGASDGSFARFEYPERTWTTYTQTQVAPCAGCVLAKLGDGRVLKLSTSSTATELFDPASATWSSGPAFPQGGVELANPVTLDDGRVIVIDNNTGQTLKIRDPATGTWSTSSALGRHSDPQLVKLADGRVMLVGVPSGSGSPPLVAQVWDPSTGDFTPTVRYVRLRTNPGVVALPNGRVIAIGGKRVVGGYTEYYDDAEIWDPVFNAWTLIDSFEVATAREKPGVALLPGGSVLAAGGISTTGATPSAFRFDPIADGESCVPPEYGAACAAAYCVDGVCCQSASCPGGTCAAPAVPGRPAGTCALNLGQACAEDFECASGYCVDAVCCDSACDGQCEACNAPPTPGVCRPVVGSPWGGRAACDDGGSNPCQARECDGNDATTCAGYANGATVECARASCSGSDLIPSSTCDGQGTCVTPPVASCGRYACDTELVACRKDCVSNGDCAEGFFCLGGICSEGAQCSDDRLESTSTDGITVRCDPFLCGTEGTCLETCRSTDDCASSAVCDTGGGVGVCVRASRGEAPEDGGCGCAIPGSRRPLPWSVFGLGLLCALGPIRRRRRP